MAETLTLRQLAGQTGEPEKRLREWRLTGLIGRRDAREFLPEDVERVRLVQLCLRHGISLEAIARANDEYGLLDSFLDQMFPRGVGSTYSLPEAAELLGLDVALLRRVATAAGYFDQAETVREQDIEALRVMKAITAIGFPEEALVQGVKVYADSMARIAEMESRLFHFYVHGNLKAQGLTGKALMEATQTASDRASALVEPTILFFHRLGFERALREDLVLHMVEEAGLMPESQVPGEMTLARAFVDLSSFTSLTAAMGDAAAAEVLQRFSDLVRQAVSRWDGRIVKQIGDAFMLVFQKPSSAVACALETQSQVAKEPQFPAARVGIHWGSVLYREGDYVGSNVNIASRLASEADRHQILVTAELRKEAHDIPDAQFVRFGKRRLKGLTGQLELFDVHSIEGPGAEKAVDLVCGMELGPAEISARLTLDGQERAFCSEACLRKFVATPEQYVS